MFIQYYSASHPINFRLNKSRLKYVCQHKVQTLWHREWLQTYSAICTRNFPLKDHFKTFPFFSRKAFLFLLSKGVSKRVEDGHGILSWFTCKPQATSSPPRKVIWPCAQGNSLSN